MEITNLIIILGVFGFILVIVFYLLLNKKFQELTQDKSKDQAYLMLNQNLEGLQNRLDKVSDGLNTRLDNAARVIGEVNKELGSVQEMGRQMKDLQDFLRSPKLRGNIGEQILEDLLNQHFPQGYFAVQHKFKSGEIVDAMLKTDRGMICVDAKFPLENFKRWAQAEGEALKESVFKDFVRDVKKHILDISKKYILPEEGTVDFALMYVPSEAIYYEIIRQKEPVMDFAQEKKVLLVSPNSFFYFLQVLMIGMQGRQIEAASKKILELMQAMHKDSGKLGESLRVLNKHLTDAKGSLERVDYDFQTLNNSIEQIKLLK